LKKTGLQYCELCGAPIFGKRYVVEIEGAELTICPACYLKLVKSGKIKIPKKQRKQAAAPSKQSGRAIVSTRQQGKTGKTQLHRPSRIPLDKYEVVEDYAERIRTARQQLGITRAELARRVQEREVTLGKIETGRLKPTLELARRLEKVLKIRLCCSV